jgi:hypothetical protein
MQTTTTSVACRLSKPRHRSRCPSNGSNQSGHQCTTADMAFRTYIALGKFATNYHANCNTATHRRANSKTDRRANSKTDRRANGPPGVFVLLLRLFCALRLSEDAVCARRY